MPNFNFLPNNKSEFPHVDNVDVFKFDNNFDYGRFDYTQMSLQICTVPWDMGEAHIGNRTISGIGNVVYFETKTKRDAWFAAIPDDQCYRFDTKFKELHRDNFIDVPIPYDMCAKHNYLVVHYNKFANDSSPVQFEGDTGLVDWFWFIREVEFLAPNTTRLHIMDDAFQTWIYDVNVSGMVLERGHAPMFAMRADEFLTNPIENNSYLLTEDVNFGEAGIVKHVDALALNAGTMYACIATTANVTGNWTYTTPANAYNTVNGVPSVSVFCVLATDLNTFLARVTSLVPQFKQTVQGVFFASSELITLAGDFTFADMPCHWVTSNRKTLDFVELSKSEFGYASRYADLAKLYTSPYARIEITDENGNVDVVNIEDTTGTLQLSAAMSLAYPFITIDAHLMGVGGSAGATVTFRNVDSKTFTVTGQWYDTLRTWDVPTFAVVLDAASEYDYSTHFDRIQRANDYTTAYANASDRALNSKTNADASALTNKTNMDANATTAKTNADANANTAKANADDSADTAAANSYTSAGATQGNAYDAANTLVDNAALTQAANTATTARSNVSANDSSSYTQTYNTGVATADNLLVGASASSTIAAADQQAAISAASGMASSAVGAVTSAVSGDVAGAIGSVVNGAIGGIATMASTAVANNLTAANATYAEASNSAHATAANTKTTWDTTNQTDTATDLTDINNDLIYGTTDNSAGMQIGNANRTYTAETTIADATQTMTKGNALRTQTTDLANNTRNYDTQIANNTRNYNTSIAINQNNYDTDMTIAARDRTNAQNDIANDVAQAALRTPFIYGQFANGRSATTKPIALFANIVTQSKSAIESAGDEFLRYGYRLDRQWDFNGNWNVGKYFTYWKLRDFWVTNLNVPDMYMDRLRFFLFGGVTVWRTPEDIGKRTVYENFN